MRRVRIMADLDRITALVFAANYLDDKILPPAAAR